MLKIAEKKTRWAMVLVILTGGVMFLAGCGAGNPVAKVDQPQGKVEIRPASDGVFQIANHGTLAIIIGKTSID
ncbi:MAG: hypothetical protein EOM23_11040 [Candidatus Moranbacteria bacterium]|nr:hypothetical protein [Candidatus Moranbacteria bacterium]